MNKLAWIKISIGLDLLLLKFKYWSMGMKLEFLAKKYVESFLLLLGLRKFRLGQSKVVLFGKDAYYDTPLGLAIYQSMVGRFGKIFDLVEKSKIKTVVDVGANVGFFSLTVSDITGAKIYAIEPVPATFETLTKNVRGSKTIHAFQLAMSSKKGKQEFFFDDLNSLGSHFVIGTEEYSPSTHRFSVKTLTLDDFCRERSINKIDLLKIDVETFENQVLKGAKDTLAKTKYLLMEISVENNRNYTFSEINSLLYGKEFNYQLLWFRSFTGGEGKLKVGDFLFENIKLRNS